MASFRKTSTKSRAALAASTAVPMAVTADVLDHAGEQAAMMASDVMDAPEAMTAEAPLVLEPPPETAASLLDEAVHHAIETAATPLEPAGEPVVDAKPIVEDVVAASIVQPETAGADVADVAVATAEPGVEHTGAAAVPLETPQVAAAPAAGALTQIQARMADALQSSFDDALSYWTALIGVRSMPEAVSLNTRHLHRQVEVFTLQSRDLAVLVQKAAADMMDPFRRMPAN